MNQPCSSRFNVSGTVYGNSMSNLTGVSAPLLRRGSQMFTKHMIVDGAFFVYFEFCLSARDHDGWVDGSRDTFFVHIL